MKILRDIVLVVVLGMLAVGLLAVSRYFVNRRIQSFNECVESGGKILLTYPEQCMAPDGRTFPKPDEVPLPTGVSGEKISTPWGELILSYDGDTAILSGELTRPTPCVEWDVSTGNTEDYPTSYVFFDIEDKNKDKDMVCTQVLGSPQQIYASVDEVQEDTAFSVAIQGETVFSGTAEASTRTVVVPVLPGEDPFSKYPDLPVQGVVPSPMSVQYVIEHRSALNEKTANVEGYVITVLTQEEACPPNMGMCGQPSVFLADTTEDDRDPYYDLRITAPDDVAEADYPVGKKVTLRIEVSGERSGVIGRLLTR